jgi:hypothetical protein
MSKFCRFILTIGAVFTAALCIVAAPAAAASPDAEPGFEPLFDGRTLSGWEGDPRLWKVEDGVIVGSTEGVKITANTFLVYRKKEFGDFTLRADVKLRNHNSGIQFRSEELPDFVVRGYQADMAEGNWWGSIYEEKGTRGVMVNGWKGKAEKVVKPNDWNSVEVRCQGDQIQVTVNGLVTAELRDSVRTSGVIALQLHTGPPMEVRFRNLRIQELK